MLLFRFMLILCLLATTIAPVKGQDGFSDQTRALYILDISKYVQFDTSFQSTGEFTITVLSEQLDLYWELENLAKTRKTIQGKPIRIRVTTGLQDLPPSQVVYVNSRERYRISEVLKVIAGTHTLLISEGFPFRSSMINFVVVDGEPRFEANEELMKQEGLFVSELFLAQAVKTREDWEALYEITEEELEKEKIITEQQNRIIERQRQEIIAQQELIDQQQKLIRNNEEILSGLRREIDSREKDIAAQARVLDQQESDIAGQEAVIRQQADEVSTQKEILAAQEKEIRTKEQTINQKEQLIEEQDQSLVLQAEAIQKQRIIIYSSAVALLLLTGLVYFIWRNYNNKKKANILLKAQRDQIAYQKKHITDSINYAKKIQAAILPSMELFSDRLDHFVLFKPRDIVSGDFYWVEELDQQLVIIAADCTGHGVPGAFMSMLGVSLLNEIILAKRIMRPNQILNELREKVIVALKQKKECRIMDGMDMAVCTLDRKQGILLYSGALNPLYHISGETLTQVKADPMPVAIHETMTPFTLHEVKLKAGDTFYIFSDGYIDQFGGPMQKKYMAKNFRKFLLAIQDKPMIEQGELLNAEFLNYRKEVEQVDDVLVVGVRYNE
jgi:serine phosphatase RsbU (regulator of sigma subunit)